MVELKEFDFEADIYAPKQNEIPRLTQYDTSIALNFFLTSKFAPLDLTNSTVKARFLVPKINQLVEQGIEIIDATEGVCRVLIDDSVTVEPGTIQGLLDVFDTNGHKLSVLKFSMIVDEYLGDKDGDITSDTNYPILNQLIESISILRGDLLETEERLVENFNQEIEKTNTRIEELFQSVSNGKELLASALTDKGIPTLATESFEEIARKILSLGSGEVEELFNLITKNGDNLVTKNGDNLIYKGAM